MRRTLGCSLLWWCALLGGCASPGGRQDQAELRDLVYAMREGQPLGLDLYRAGGSRPGPVLVHVHGGGWSRGARPPSSGMFTTWLANGISVVAIDYRLSGQAHAPAAVQDVRCALAWIRTNARHYGLDQRRIVLQGVSAGGHLALLAAFAPAHAGFDAPGCAPTPVAAVLDYYGIADLTTWHPSSRAVQRWIGPRVDSQAYAWELSPQRHVRTGLPPVFIAHGDEDQTVPLAQSQRLLSALQREGVAASLQTVPGGRHGNFSAAQTAEVDAAALLFLRRQGVLGVEEHIAK